jgi:O-antigen/teichoic acid export membrane protein
MPQSNFFGKIISTLIGFFTTALMLRYLQPAGFGGYTAAIAYVGFFSVVADLGLYMILMRDFNRPGADREKILGNVLGLRWASALFVLGLSTIVAFFLPFYSPEVRQAIAICAVSFVAVAGTQLLVAVFQTYLVAWWVSIGEILGRCVLLGSVLTVIALHGGLLSMMVAVLLGSAVNFLFMIVMARRYVRVRVRFELVEWKKIFLDALPISISIVLNLLYFKADTIFLSVFQKGDEAIGLYGAAYKVLEILITFPIMFVGLLLPALAQTFAAEKKEEFMNLFQRGVDALLLLVAPIKFRLRCEMSSLRSVIAPWCVLQKS